MDRRSPARPASSRSLLSLAVLACAACAVPPIADDLRTYDVPKRATPASGRAAEEPLEPDERAPAPEPSSSTSTGPAPAPSAPSGSASSSASTDSKPPPPPLCVPNESEPNDVTAQTMTTALACGTLAGSDVDRWAFVSTTTELTLTMRSTKNARMTVTTPAGATAVVSGPQGVVRSSERGMFRVEIHALAGDPQTYSIQR